MKINKKKKSNNLDFKIIAEGGSGEHGTFGGGKVAINKPITQNLNLSLSQRGSFVKPKSKAGRLKSKDTTIGLQYTKKFDF